ncbi:MAG: four helix bundle protein [Treponema sp.]|jgi:four helix bundle protein|nr:four helix bundle protein [Treponema sp.]
MIIALEKSRKFAIRIYVLYKYLIGEKQEHTLANQLLRSGTAIGAILSETQYINNQEEALEKAANALRECAETEYWLGLLKDARILSPYEYNNIIRDCKEILNILVSTIKSSKQKNELLQMPSVSHRQSSICGEFAV